jgi:hypothetical protein
VKVVRFTVGLFTVGWLAVLGARCLVCQFTVVQFTVVQFTVHSFSVYGFSVYFYCRFARALSFRAESRNRQALIIASFSTPLELTDLAWKVEGMNLYSNKQNLTISILEKMLRASA